MNLFFNYVLVFGNWGFPALGVQGSAWATLFSRIFMATTMLGFAGYEIWRERIHFSWALLKPNYHSVTAIWGLGFPSAFQILLEVGVFSVSTMLSSKFSAISLAAHQVTLNLASLTFMIPLGISSATAVKMGESLGMGRRTQARNFGWMGLLMATTFMSVTAVLFFFFRSEVVSLYTSDTQVIQMASGLMLLVAFFQLFDGAQVALTGMFRGTGDTRTSMFVNLVGHWGLGFPLGLYFGFTKHLGVLGIWYGLTAGLVFVAIILFARWLWVAKNVLN